MLKRDQSEKRADANDHSTAVTKHAPKGSVSHKINNTSLVKMDDGDLVLEKFSSCNLESSTKSQSGNPPFTSGGGIKRAKVK